MFDVINFWNDLWNIVPHVFNWGYLLTLVAIIIIIISQNQSPYKTISWILVLALVPVVGILLYIFLGQNYRKQKIFSRKGLIDFIKFEELSTRQLSDIDRKALNKKDQFLKDKIKIIKLLLQNNKAILTYHNKCQILNNGKQKYELLFEKIAKAKHHIHLEYYIFYSDNIGEKLGNLLISKAKEGVKVRIIYDHVGSWEIRNRFIKHLEKEGIEVGCFMPVKLPFLTRKINFRNHRKIAVIDGKVGFLGGINIADHYLHGKKNIPFWRDTHLMLEGESVNALQIVFATDWFFIKNELLEQAVYYPKPTIKEQCMIQIVTSGPDSDWESIMQAYFTSINLAKRNVYISTPYLLPNESILTALKTASLSGIDVKILIPGISDSFLVYYATLSFVKELLEAGIEIYFYRKGFNHSKILLIDNEFCSVGTANMDYRSFSQNFEVTALIYDPAVTSELTYWFLEDLKDSEIVNFQEWDNRSKIEKFKASVARIASPML